MLAKRTGPRAAEGRRLADHHLVVDDLYAAETLAPAGDQDAIQAGLFYLSAETSSDRGIAHCAGERRAAHDTHAPRGGRGGSDKRPGHEDEG